MQSKVSIYVTYTTSVCSLIPKFPLTFHCDERRAWERGYTESVCQLCNTWISDLLPNL